jgi:hypothetical protein
MALRFPCVGDESEGRFRTWWTGDVWKIIPVLRKFRPDLKLFIFDCAPTGLVVVSNLDSGSNALRIAYGDILDELRDLDLERYTIRRLWSDCLAISSQSLVKHPEDLTLFLNFH